MHQMMVQNVEAEINPQERQSTFLESEPHLQDEPHR